MKKCSGCLIDKDESDFGFRSKTLNKRFSRCRVCQNTKRREKYKTSPNKKPELNRKSVAKYRIECLARNRKFVVNYLAEHPCVDCGETDIVVLEFDHVRDIKRRTISRLMVNCSIDSLIKEIEKCEVRCANCHKRKTSKQFNFYKEYLK